MMGRKTQRTMAVLIIASIATATITTGLCSGPLHTIFPSWIDTTSCLNYGGCIIGDTPAADRDTGAFVILFLLVFFAVMFVLGKLFGKWWNSSENAKNI